MFLSRNKENIDTFGLKKAPDEEQFCTMFTLSVGTPQLLTIFLLKLEQGLFHFPLIFFIILHDKWQML